MRLTRVDACGKPAGGACGQIVTDGFISVAYSPTISEAEAIEVKNAAGRVCLSDPGCPTITGVGIELTLCGVNPDVLAFVTGQEAVVDYAGVSTGHRLGKNVSCDTGFALEVWTTIPGARCTTTGERLYGYVLVPYIVNGVLGDFSIANEALNLTLSGTAVESSQWGRGAYDITAQDAAGTPGPLLTPITPDEFLHLDVVTVAPPSVPADCGCFELVLPASYTTDADGDDVPDNRDRSTGITAPAGFAQTGATAANGDRTLTFTPPTTAQARQVKAAILTAPNGSRTVIAPPSSPYTLKGNAPAGSYTLAFSADKTGADTSAEGPTSTAVLP